MGEEVRPVHTVRKGGIARAGGGIILRGGGRIRGVFGFRGAAGVLRVAGILGIAGVLGITGVLGIAGIPGTVCVARVRRVFGVRLILGSLGIRAFLILLRGFHCVLFFVHRDSLLQSGGEFRREVDVAFLCADGKLLLPDVLRQSVKGRDGGRTGGGSCVCRQWR